VPVIEVESLGEVLLGNLGVGGVHDTSRWSVVLEATTNGVGELSARVGVAIENFNEGIARFLAGEVRPDDGAHIAMVDPLFHDDGADRVYDYNSVAASLGGSKDEVITPLLCVKVISVTDIVVPRDVPFSGVGIDEDEADVLLGRVDFNFSKQGVVQDD